LSDSIHNVISDVFVTPRGMKPACRRRATAVASASARRSFECDDAGAVRHPRDADRLLDRAGDAQERWRVGVALDPLVRPVGLGQRVGEAVAGERVGARLAGVEAVDVRLHDLARGQLLGADRGREVGGAALGELRGRGR
jgi:hypothetical protein